MAGLTLRVLGPVRAAYDDRDIDVGGPQARALLAVLASVAPMAATREALIAALWPDDPPASAAKSVQKHVSLLRTRLGRAAIETVGGGYRLAATPDAVDAHRFAAGVRAARGVDDPADRSRLLTDALTLWDGEPYAGVGELPFVHTERTRLHALRLDTEIDRLAAELALGHHDAALADLHDLCARHPSDERLAALYMRALYAADRQTLALDVYQRTRTHLRDELGVDVSPQLRELQLQILNHASTLRSDSRVPSPSEQRPLRDPESHARARLSPDAVESSPEPDEEEVRDVIVVLAIRPGASGSPDDDRAAQRELMDELLPVAQRFDARLEAGSGRRVLLVFGLPAHDDDLRRATAAAGEAAAARPEIRVGVAAGSVIVTERDRSAVAAVADRAAELVRGGGPGGDGPGAVRLAPDVEAGLAHLAGAPTTSRLLGRAYELELIHRVWTRVGHERRSRQVHLVGEAGIGKTRLIDAVIEALQPLPAHVLRLSFPPYGDRSVAGAVAAMLRQLLGPDGRVRSWLEQQGVDETEVSWLSARLDPLLGPRDLEEAGGQGERWNAALARFVRLLADKGPIVVRVEDVHWAGDDFEAFLTETTDRLRESPLLLVTTGRSPPISHTASASEDLTLTLGPLDSEAARDMGQELAGGKLPPETVNALAAHSGGNPLFVQQFVRMLLDRRAARLGGEAPTSVRLVVAARLDHIRIRERTVLQAATVIREAVETGALAAMLDRATDDVRRDVSALVRAGLLRTSAAGPVGADERYEFHHAVIADVADSQLTRVRRIDLHLRAASWLQEHRATGVDQLRAVAWHWTQAVALTRAERRDVGTELRARARRALVDVGERLVHVDAGLAAQTFRDALTLTPEGTRDRAEVLVRLGSVDTDVGDYVAATTALAEAAEIFLAAGDRRSAGEAFARQARAARFLGDAARTDALLEQSLLHLEGVPHGREVVAALALVAIQRALRGDVTEALELARREMPVIRRHGTVEEVVRMLHVIGMCGVDLDDPTAVAALDEALQLSLRSGHSRLASQSYNNLAEMVWSLEGPREAMALAQQGLALANARGIGGQASWHVAQLTELRGDLGEWDAILHPPEPTTHFDALAAVSVEALAARVRFWRGDDVQTGVLADVVGRARTARDRQTLVPVLAWAIAAAAERGEVRQTASLGREILSVTDRERNHRLKEAGDAVRGMLRAGLLDLAVEYLDLPRPQVLRRRLHHDAATALLAEAQGRHGEAAGGFAQVEMGWAAFPHPYEAAHAALGLARCMVRMGADGRPAAERARDRFAALGVTRLGDDLARLHG